MANVKFTIPLDNFVQNGDQTESELIASLAAINGDSPGIANRIRDPATGKLVSIELSLPEADEAQATARINANPGVPVVVLPVPAPLTISNLDATDGIVNTGTALTADQQVSGNAAPTLTGSDVTQLGVLISTGYVDDAEELSAGGFVVVLVNSDTVNDLVVATGDLTFKTAGGATVPLVLSSPIIVPKPPSGQNQFSAWMDSTGKAYPRLSIINGVLDPFKDYAAAVAVGAL